MITEVQPPHLSAAAPGADPFTIVYLLTRADTVGGVQVHVRDLAQALLRQGHRATVLVGGDGPYTAALARQGVPFRALRHLVHPIRPLEDWQAFCEIRAALRALRPDLVSTHSSKAGFLGRLAAASLGIPALFTAHGWAFTDGIPPTAARRYCRLERFAGRFSQRILTVSEYDRQLALRYDIAARHKLITVHNGMPDVPEGMRAQPGATPPRLIMVARFEEQKDHRTLLAALATLQDLPWSIDLVGDGPGRTAMEALAAELGIAARVRFLGERHDVAQLLAASQVFLLISNWEGFPRSILEAMRAGLPVVASDVGGSREAIVEGETGWLIPRGDADTLAQRLRPLLADPRQRMRMGAASRQRYAAHFTFEHMAARTVAIYQALVAQQRTLR